MFHLSLWVGAGCCGFVAIDVKRDGLDGKNHVEYSVCDALNPA